MAKYDDSERDRKLKLLSDNRITWKSCFKIYHYIGHNAKTVYSQVLYNFPKITRFIFKLYKIIEKMSLSHFIKIEIPLYQLISKQEKQMRNFTYENRYKH